MINKKILSIIFGTILLLSVVVAGGISILTRDVYIEKELNQKAQESSLFYKFIEKDGVNYVCIYDIKKMSISGNYCEKYKKGDETKALEKIVNEKLSKKDIKSTIKSIENGKVNLKEKK